MSHVPLTGNWFVLLNLSESGKEGKDEGLLRALKGKAYANEPCTIQELENNIRREIAAISEDVLQVTFANMKRRVQLCLDSGGEHFQHLL